MRVQVQYGFELEVPDKTYLSERLDEEHVYEKEEGDLVLQLVRPGDVCVDGGSHVGYFSCLMAMRGANVYAFEPNEKLWLFLVDNTKGMSVMPVLAALSDTNGTAQFFMPDTWDDGWGSLIAAKKDGDDPPVGVLTVRLDLVLPPGPIRLIKLDVEGSEVPALLGLGKRLADVDYLLIECQDARFRVEKSGFNVAQINMLLDGWGVKYLSGTEWVDVAVAGSNSKERNNFLFVNPRLK